MPALKPQDIRNIVFVGHGGAGKTTLGEAMLHVAGVTGRLGSVDDGTSHLDYTDIEKERKHSVDPALGFLENKDKTINIIDAPGYPDFIGGASCALGGALTRSTGRTSTWSVCWAISPRRSARRVSR